MLAGSHRLSDSQAVLLFPVPGQLQMGIGMDETEALLAQQEVRWWSIKIQSFNSKGRFLRYAGRYVRRPPIAQRRITFIGERSVTFWAKDKKRRCRVNVTCSLEDFIDRWAQHIPERSNRDRGDA